MLSSFYQVTIAGIAGSGDSAGFIDAEKVEYYMANAVSPSTPNTLTDSENKVRANLRYQSVVQSLQGMANMYVSDVQAPGADANTPPTSFTFTVEVERGDTVLYTNDELNAGQQLSGANAIVRCVARGLCETRANTVWAVYNPTSSVANQNGANTGAYPRVGASTLTFTVGALSPDLLTAANSVTVSLVQGGS